MKALKKNHNVAKRNDQRSREFSIFIFKLIFFPARNGFWLWCARFLLSLSFYRSFHFGNVNLNRATKQIKMKTTAGPEGRGVKQMVATVLAANNGIHINFNIVTNFSNVNK